MTARRGDTEPSKWQMLTLHDFAMETFVAMANISLIMQHGLDSDDGA